MILIDVRTPDEYAQKHAAHAENFPLQDMKDGKMPNYPLDSEINVHCQSGGRSEAAKSLMEKHGFTNVINAGGLHDVI